MEFLWVNFSERKITVPNIPIMNNRIIELDNDLSGIAVFLR